MKNKKLQTIKEKYLYNSIAFICFTIAFIYLIRVGEYFIISYYGYVPKVFSYLSLGLIAIWWILFICFIFRKKIENLR